MENKHISFIIIVFKEYDINNDMRFKQFLLLKESPIGYENTSLGQDDLEAYGTIYSKKEPSEVFSNNGFTYKIYDSNGYLSSSIWLVYKEEELVGVTKLSDAPRFKEVIATIIKKGTRGKGIGTELYKNVIEKYGYIVSDEQLSNNESGSWYLYKKLIPQYNSYELIYDAQHRTWEIEKIEEMPKERKSRIVLSKKEIKSVEDLK